MTSNVTESMNAVVVHARALPVTALLEHVRALLQWWFYERRTYASSRETILTDYGETKMRTAENVAQTHPVIPINHHEFDVSDGLKMVRVNLNTMTCGCKQFDYFQFPCSHAIAVATLRNVNRYTLCSPTYSLQTLITAYAESVYPPNDIDDWILPDDFVEVEVEPSKIVKHVGQRQTVRISSVGETRQFHKCGRCGNMGHNKKTCRQPLRTTVSDVDGV
ncbi:uncharacterized protein LOC111018510 [Momordica charantia]|uniref:Uncharacterized protein LOC111018510 n=1 Tax=Momordica charantia TaxID=3673 RepID=A0A6J1DAE4_MOMCH|nr:uncharacterized protein LOC111018510 [Momordica charantia]